VSLPQNSRRIWNTDIFIKRSLAEISRTSCLIQTIKSLPASRHKHYYNRFFQLLRHSFRVFKWYRIIFVNFIAYIKGPQISTISRSHLQIFEATRVTRNTMHTQDSKFECYLWIFLLSGAFCSVNKDLHTFFVCKKKYAYTLLKILGSSV